MSVSDSRKRCFGFLAVLLATLACVLVSCGSPSSQYLALGEPYDKACQAMAERASDARLIAVQTSSDVAAGESPNWMYLFGSQEKGYLYSVFLQEGTAVVGDYNPVSWSEEQWNVVPDANDVAVSSAEAYETAKQEYQKTQEVYSYSQYLVLYMPEETETSTSPMVWEIVFDAAADADMGSAEDAEDESGEQADAVSGTCYTVDAVTREVGRKVVVDGDSE